MPFPSAHGRRRARPAARRPGIVLLPRRQVPCALCGLCCTYVTADIGPPTTVERASRIVWYLYHEGVSVWWDRASAWLVQFETRCRFFGDDGRCEVHARRPHVCRDLDERTCEVNAPDEGLLFQQPAPFLDWLARRRPSVHARLLAAGLVPDAETLRREPAARGPLTPYIERYTVLRESGAEKMDPARKGPALRPE